MKNKAVVAIRGGRIVVHVPNATVRSDGTIWYRGRYPLLDSEAEGALPAAEAARLIKAGKLDDIPASMYAHMGTTQSGMRVMWSDDWDAERRAKYDTEHPGAKERQAIRALLAQAEDLRHLSREDNAGRYIRLTVRAALRLSAWREQYPDEARAEDMARLQDLGFLC